MPNLTQKGQVTIPKRVRKILEIEQGDEILFEIENEKVIIKKSQKKANFNKYVGYLSDQNEQKSDDIVRYIREGI